MELNQNSELICAEEIEPKEVEWLWHPYIPFGKITLIQGDPGDGKSTLALSIAALLTNGLPLPFEEDNLEPMNVIYQNTEDDADDTVIPRFIKQGGDRSRLFFIDESEQSITFGDYERIKRNIIECDAKVIIFDPMTSYIGEDISYNQANEVRSRMNKLIRVAKETGCALIVIGHLNKSEGSKALYRSMGSVDIVGSARSCLVIGVSEENPDHRIIAVQKSNLARKGQSIEFSVADGTVEFIRKMDMTADELLSSFSLSAGKNGISKRETAKEMLLEMLNEGAKSQQEVMQQMRKFDISRRTADEAKAELEVKSEKIGKQWFWSLP